MSLRQQIAWERGQPATVRVGEVTSVSPPRVLVQGTEMEGVGVLHGGIGPVGSFVAVLGQSSVSADGSSWLVLGEIDPGVSSVGVHFDAEELVATWNSNSEQPLSGYEFEATLRAGRLYCVKASFLVSATAGANDFPFMRIYKDSTTVYGYYAQTKPSNIDTFNYVEVWVREPATITLPFRMTAQRQFGASTFTVKKPLNGFFGIIDYGGLGGVITPI